MGSHGTSPARPSIRASLGASPDIILHVPETGPPIAGSFSSSCAGPMTGVAVGVVSAETPAFSGSVLFVACPEDVSVEPPPPEIRQIKRADGALVTSVDLPTGSFVPPTSFPGDVECDPVTFAVSQSWHPTIRNKDVLWVKDTDAANPHKVYAMELPFAACGPVPPPPTSAANLCDLDLDTDGDGLPDCWENGTWWAGGLPGIALDGVYTPGRADTSKRFTLCVNGSTTDCATPLQRDVFVEIDYMQFHRPDSNAVADVVSAFLAAPAFAATSGKCDGAGCTPGIRLHVQVDEQALTHFANTALFPCTGPKGGATPTSTRPRPQSLGPLPSAPPPACSTPSASPSTTGSGSTTSPRPRPRPPTRPPAAPSCSATTSWCRWGAGRHRTPRSRATPEAWGADPSRRGPSCTSSGITWACATAASTTPTASRTT